MESGRRRIHGGAVLSFFLASCLAAAEDIRVSIDETEIVVEGIPENELSEEIARISVSEDAPAILGEYHVAEGRLYFRPMFPFDPGRDYFVHVATAEPFATTVALPARELRPSTVIERIYPTGELLPENQLKLYIHFSAPMAGGDGLRYIKLLDENDEEVIDPFLPLGEAFWDRERRRYTVFFDPGRVKRGILPNEEMGRPILEGKSYRLEIDPAWPDAQGQPLAEGHRKDFIAGAPDENPIETTTWSLTVPSSGSRDPLIVHFGEPLDHGVLVRALTVSELEGAARISAGETKWSFTPMEPWRSGTYHLVALAFLEDLAGNRIGQKFEVDIFERIDSPDDGESVHEIAFTIGGAQDPPDAPARQ